MTPDKIAILITEDITINNGLINKDFIDLLICLIEEHELYTDQGQREIEDRKAEHQTQRTAMYKAIEILFKKYLRHPSIKQFRSKGLLIAAEFADEKTVREIIKKCIDKGVIVDWFLFAPYCMRIAPPLIISEAEIDLMFDRFEKALDKTEEWVRKEKLRG